MFSALHNLFSRISSPSMILYQLESRTELIEPIKLKWIEP